MRISDWSSDVCSSDLFWGAISAGTVTVGDTLKRGGISSTAGIWIEGSTAVPVVQIDKLVVRMTKPDTIIRIEQGPIDLRIGSCDIQAPEGTQFIVSESSATKTRSAEHTSELQSLIRNSYAVFCQQK